ncbi:BQ2448_5376 [Microbotryum intermedium]|uniref:biotin synthase n=1 Tax=Microbotryum intermedium TaxID=269621 RepID=A0A238F420_9BASI|nr:BQ2448_5376 [Microbotryum intermedium]
MAPATAARFLASASRQVCRTSSSSTGGSSSLLAASSRSATRGAGGAAVIKAQFDGASAGSLIARRGNATAVEAPGTKQWSREDVQKVYDTPLMDLIFRAVSRPFELSLSLTAKQPARRGEAEYDDQKLILACFRSKQASVHRVNHPSDQVQLCTLLNIKTGGCGEDCSYCAQSSKYSDKVGLKAEKLTEVEPVLIEARKAKANGSTRFCMGAAWRDLSGRKRGFERILKMVEGVRALDMEVCTTLGMLSPEQAQQLKKAGLTAYNHNLDTSREYYPKVITTRKYDERLETLAAVREAGISVCSGGIIGLGEDDGDRVGLIWEMSQLPEAPESFPVNALVAIPGTPLEKNERVTITELLRTIATARIVLPTSIIRFAAGRISYTESEQAMCFMAGANAIFTGERMLTTPTSGWDEDISMLSRWGLKGMKSFESATVRMKEDEAALKATEERKAIADAESAQAQAQIC